MKLIDELIADIRRATEANTPAPTDIWLARELYARLLREGYAGDFVLVPTWTHRYGLMHTAIRPLGAR